MALGLVEWYCDWWIGTAIGGMALRLADSTAIAGMALRLVEWHCDCWNGTAICGMTLRLVEWH